MTYKIVSKFIKDLSFEIPNSKSYFLLEKNIKNYKFVCDIKSKQIRPQIIQVDVSLGLVSIDKSLSSNISVQVELTSLVQIDEKTEKKELEKIVLVKVPNDIYPEIRGIIVYLFEKSGFNKINIDEKIDFLKLFESRKN